MLLFFNSKLKFMIYFNFETLEINFGRYLAHIMKSKIIVLSGKLKIIVLLFFNVHFKKVFGYRSKYFGRFLTS